MGTHFFHIWHSHINRVVISVDLYKIIWPISALKPTKSSGKPMKISVKNTEMPPKKTNVYHCNICSISISEIGLFFDVYRPGVGTCLDMESIERMIGGRTRSGTQKKTFRSGISATRKWDNGYVMRKEYQRKLFSGGFKTWSGMNLRVWNSFQNAERKHFYT